MTERDFRRKLYSCTTSCIHIRQVLRRLVLSFMSEWVITYTKWISLSGIDESFDALRELILKESFLFVYPRDLFVFMREHKRKDDDEFLDLLNTFTNARLPIISSTA